MSLELYITKPNESGARVEDNKSIREPIVDTCMTDPNQITDLADKYGKRLLVERALP